MLGVLTSASLLRADLAEDLANKYVEALGGGAAMNLLQSLRATGRTTLQSTEVETVMWAARPNRIRVESRYVNKLFIQGYDGENPPWQSNSEVKDGAPIPLPASEVKSFLSDSDFDGALVNYAQKGYSLDYVGTAAVEGKPVHKLLLAASTGELMYFVLDAKTYLLVERVSQKIIQGRKAEIHIYYRDYRRVGGVLMPYQIEAKAGERTLYITTLNQVVANPALPSGVFSSPVS
ncbi:MAG TPA: hypothetical protein VKC60_16405 [Opitutaceae bacterium]|nr:hypothetical protein [Opitutaceae bacterium]